MTRFRASTPICRSTRSRSWALSSLRHFRRRCNLLSRVVRLVTIYGHLFNKLLRWISRWSPSAVGSVHLEWSSRHNPLHAIDANYVSMILQKPPTVLFAPDGSESKWNCFSHQAMAQARGRQKRRTSRGEWKETEKCKGHNLQWNRSMNLRWNLRSYTQLWPTQNAVKLI